MKQFFLFGKACLLLIGLMCFSSKAFAQAINYELSLQQQVLSGSLVVDIKVKKTGGADAALGNVDLVLNVNPDLLNALAATKDAAGDGLWDNGNSAANYNDMTIEKGDGFVKLKIRRRVPGAGGVNIPSNLAQVGRIKFPIIDCNSNGRAVWSQDEVVLARWDSTEIKDNSNAGVATFINPELMPLRAVGLPTTFTTSATTICNTAALSMTAPSGFSSYSFYKKTGTADPKLLKTQSSNTFTYTPTIASSSTYWLDGDTVYSVYSNGYCLYTTDKVVLTVHSKLSMPPVPTSSVSLATGFCGASPIPNTTFTIPAQATATSYVWSVNPAQGGSIVSNGSNSVEIDWNESYTGKVYITVYAVNICGDGVSSSPAVARISATAPNKPNAPSNTNFTSTDVICINNTLNNVYRTDTVANVASYSWRVIPTDAVNSQPVGTISGAFAQSVISWNRKYQGTTATIFVKANNGCGSSVEDSIKIQLQPLPPKANKPQGDSVIFCQKRVAYTTTYTVDPIPGIAATNGYRWYVLNDATGAILTGATAPATSTPSVTITWPSNFSGKARVVVGGFSAACQLTTATNPYSFAAAAAGRSMGDTGVLVVTVKPLPAKPANIKGIRGFCNTVPIASTTYSVGKVLGATSYQWSISSSLSAQGAVITGTDTSAILTFGPTTNGGLYTVRVRGFNDCGVGPWSPAFNIQVNDAPPGPATPLLGNKIVCAATPSTLYATGSADAASYVWTIIPTEAGTFIPKNDTSAIDEDSVMVQWSPTYVGGVRVTATPINGCGSATVATDTITVAPLPVVVAGSNVVIPLGSQYSLGGSPTATSGTPPYTYVWSAVAGSLANVTQLSSINDANPVFTPTVAGTYRFAIDVTDFNNCKAVRSIITLTVRASYLCNLNVLLEGAYSSSIGKMHDSLFVASTAGGILKDFEKYGNAAPAGFSEMSSGYSLPIQTGNNVVDVITVQLYRDSISGAALVENAYAWLLQDGTIRDFETGTKPYVYFYRATTLKAAGYFVKVLHRNHLPIFSADSVKLVASPSELGATLQTGFLNMTQPNLIFKANPNASLGAKLLNGKAAMIAADVYKGTINEVNTADYDMVSRAVFLAPASPIYTSEDVNMNGKVDVADVFFANRQNARVYYSTIP
ncbi:hypothetical protein SAMN05421780_103182 [Flexibacter flexilis DSM 6793]|uniref:PKD-like domain-containing protein n=1 Tax=Flexibacter flexilis DSM 6793 TaxID=927664 RepID=A0A1I1H3H9_9BACT|nr:hypothetical protein [Flexibacter flexilis]SFC18102.1 hypothetical protein SAMN05421780_103182 [Flexibacter flexilis DSM 6793]